MPNGKCIINSFVFFIACCCCLQTYAQVKDTARFNSEDFPSFKIDEQCLTKSERNVKPVLLKISREKLATITTVKQLITDIPETCDVLCVFISIKKPDDKVFEFRNIGNEMVYADRLTEGKFIMVENLATSCPTLHKSNFKIIIE